MQSKQKKGIQVSSLLGSIRSGQTLIVTEKGIVFLKQGSKPSFVKQMMDRLKGYSQ